MISIGQDQSAGKLRTIYLLDRGQITHYWPELLKELQRTKMYEFWTPAQIFERAINGAMQCWALSDGEIRLILLTDVVVHPNGVRSFRFVGAVGRDIEEFLPVAATCFGKVIRQLNCQAVEVIGRDGWGKLLKALGFEKHYTVFVKMVEPLPREN